MLHAVSARMIRPPHYFPALYISKTRIDVWFEISSENVGTKRTAKGIAPVYSKCTVDLLLEIE